MSRPSKTETLQNRAKADVGALLAGAGTARRKAVAAELAAMRKAFDTAAQSIETLLASPLKADADVEALVDGLTRQIDALAKPDGDLEGLRNSSRNARRRTRSCGRCWSRRGWTSKPPVPTWPPSGKAPIPRAPRTADATGEFDRALEEMRGEHMAVLAEQSAASIALPLDELLTVFDAMNKAETGPELLSALLAGLAREFSRVALFHVDGTRLLAAERLGFDESNTSKPIRLPADSILTRAVSTGRLESVMPGLRGEPNSSLPFGGTPACALAVPIVVQNATAAVVYADDSDHVEFATSAPHVRVKFAEILQQYALLALLRISVERKSTDALRGFAATLVAELEYAYTVEAEAGRNRLECQQRLKDSLQKARKKFADRAAGDAVAAGLFDEQLAATMTAKKESAFGRDLAALLGPSRQRGGNIVAMFR